MVVAPFFDRIPDLQSLFSGQRGKKPAGSGAAATSRAEGYERVVPQIIDSSSVPSSANIWTHLPKRSSSRLPLVRSWRAAPYAERRS